MIKLSEIVKSDETNKFKIDNFESSESETEDMFADDNNNNFQNTDEEKLEQDVNSIYSTNWDSNNNQILTQVIDQIIDSPIVLDLLAEKITIAIMENKDNLCFDNENFQNEHLQNEAGLQAQQVIKDVMPILEQTLHQALNKLPINNINKVI